MDWNTLYCPNKGCQYYGIPLQCSKMVKNGSSYGQAQALCRGCGGSVALSYATAYYGLESELAIFETAVRALAEGNSIRATGRILQIDKDSVCDWLNRAALHCRSVVLYFWSQLHVTECQLDELWGFVHTKEAHLPCAKIYCETYGDAWVWLAFAPVWRLVLAFVVGKRTQENADLLLDRVKDVSDEHIPFFTSDQLPEYDDALLHTYGVWVQPKRKGARGRCPLPRRVPTADLLYAQVVKVREHGRVTQVKTKVIFGKPEAIAEQLANSSVSDAINTSFVERPACRRQGQLDPTPKQSPSHAPDEWLFQRNHLVRKTALAFHGLLPLCLATSQLTSTAENTRTYSWDRLSKTVETGYSCNGRRHHRSHLDNNRVALLSSTCTILGSIVKDQALVCLARRSPSREMRDNTGLSGGG